MFRQTRLPTRPVTADGSGQRLRAGRELVRRALRPRTADGSVWKEIRVRIRAQIRAITADITAATDRLRRSRKPGPSRSLNRAAVIRRARLRPGITRRSRAASRNSSASILPSCRIAAIRVAAVAAPIAVRAAAAARLVQAVEAPGRTAVAAEVRAAAVADGISLFGWAH